jgi:hypothetical protein
LRLRIRAKNSFDGRIASSTSVAAFASRTMIPSTRANAGASLPRPSSPSKVKMPTMTQVVMRAQFLPLRRLIARKTYRAAISSVTMTANTTAAV